MSAPALDAEWLLSTLQRVLETTGGELDWDRAVFEKLAELADRFPEEVARCVASLVESDVRNRIARCDLAIRRTLQSLRAGPSSEAAKQTAARLVARKYPQFEDLM